LIKLAAAIVFVATVAVVAIKKGSGICLASRKSLWLPVIRKTRTIRFRLRTEFRRFRSFRRFHRLPCDFAALAAGYSSSHGHGTKTTVNDSNSGNSDAGLQDQLTKVLAERDHALASRNFQGAHTWCSRSLETSRRTRRQSRAAGMEDTTS